MSDFDEYQTEPKDQEEAAPDTERALGGFVDPSPDLSPVVPLGYSGNKIIFAMPEGEIRRELAAKIGPALKTDVFVCEAGAAFMNYWRDRDDKFQQQSAAIWFVRQCRKAGLWDDNRAIRSLGVWHGDDGAIVLHKGDEVWIFPVKGKVERLSIIQALRKGGRGPLYQLRPPAPQPEKAASVTDGQAIRDALDLWRFKPIGSEGLTGADVVAAWLLPALLGAVAPFRGHLMFDASPGAGKTTLMQYLGSLLSALAGDVLDEFTDAGLRNDLAGMARPVLIDEAESSADPSGVGPVERALDLLRRMATGSGGNRRMGSIAGGTVTQTAVGCVALAAISPPRLNPADATRIVELRLMPLNAPRPAGEADPPAPPGSASLRLDEAMKQARKLAPALLGRALKNAGRYLADVEAIKSAMVASGDTPRAADLIAMLAAGRRLLLFDAPLSPEEALDEIRLWRPLMEQREAAGAVSNTGSDALAHLMAWRTDQHRQDRSLTIGELVQRVTKGEPEFKDVLSTLGVRLWQGDYADGWFLLVANHHPVLKDRIFKGTPWSDWRRALTYLDELGPAYATKPGKKQRFGVGNESRSLAIPLAPWLEDRNAEPSSGTRRVPGDGYDF